MNKVTDPTPAPPLEGRGVPHGVPAAGKAAAAPLPCRGGVGVGSVTKIYLVLRILGFILKKTGKTLSFWLRLRLCWCSVMFCLASQLAARTCHYAINPYGISTRTKEKPEKPEVMNNVQSAMSNEKSCDFGFSCLCCTALGCLWLLGKGMGKLAYTAL